MSNSTTHKVWAGIGAIALLAAACTTKVAEETTGEGAGGAGAGTTTGGSGGAGGSVIDITQEVDLSDCGGFQPLSGSGDSGDETPPPSYCEAEVLYWTYDAVSQELAVTDSRVELNCCGDHSMVVEKQGDSLVVTETDAPEGGAGRCDCMCVFDYAATAAPVEQGVIQVELMRHVTDSGDAFSVWQGSIDLSEGSGYVIIDDEPSMWCEYDSEPLPS